MKQILLFITLATFTLFSQGQGLNFYEIGTAWKYRTYFPGMSVNTTEEKTYTIVADTTIMGMGYNVVEVFCKRVATGTSLNPPYNHTSTTTYPVFAPILIRYDIPNECVYRYTSDSTPDVLHYDFNLQIGDTLPVEAQSPTHTVVVDSIVTVKVDGYCIKKFLLATIKADTLQHINREKSYIIQGMGGSNGFNTFNPWSSYIKTEFLYAVYSGDTIRSFNDTCQLQLPTAIAGAEQKLFRLYPNPTTSTLRIDIADATLTDITITALDGRILAEHKANGNTAIDVSAMLPGLYIVTVHNAAAKGSSMLFAKE